MQSRHRAQLTGISDRWKNILYTRVGNPLLEETTSEVQLSVHSSGTFARNLFFFTSILSVVIRDDGYGNISRCRCNLLEIPSWSRQQERRDGPRGPPIIVERGCWLINKDAIRHNDMVIVLSSPFA